MRKEHQERMDAKAAEHVRVKHELEDQLAAAQESIEALNRKMVYKEKESRRLEQANKDVNRRLKELEAQSQQEQFYMQQNYNEMKGELTRKIRQLQDSNEAVVAQLKEAYETRIDHLTHNNKIEVDQVNFQLNNLFLKLNDQNLELTKTLHQYQQKSQVVDLLKNELSNDQQTIQKLKKYVQNQDHTIQEMEIANKAKDNHINQLKQEAIQLEQDI